MGGMEKVVQRISAIEQRFGQPGPAVIGVASFAGKLQEVQQNAAAKSSDATSIANLIQATAVKHGVDPKLALAVATAESSLDQTATSPVGAVGVMQLMPDTARSLGITNIYDAKENIDGGIRYLKQMLNTFGGDVTQALAAYNAGPDAVKRYGGVPPYKETQEYVTKILADYKA